MTQIAKINFLLILLIISVGINIYCITILIDAKKSADLILNELDEIDSTLDVNNSSAFCTNDGRFDDEDANLGGEELLFEDAFKIMNDYYLANKDRDDEYQTTGFTMSKNVFDKIFSDERNKKLNTVRLDLAIYNGKLSLIAKGIQRTNTGLNYLPAPNDPSRIYINQSMCPADCAETREKY